MDGMTINFILNNEQVSVDCEAGMTLLQLLRDKLNLTGTKEGCGIGECGACTVLLDGRAVNSCLIMAQSVDSHNVLTIEGVAGKDGQPSPIQEAFVRSGAVQCGFCTPGMVLAAKGLLDRNPNPSKDEIRVAISGNLCRCTGYSQIVKAISEAAQAMQSDACKGKKEEQP